MNFVKFFTFAALSFSSFSVAQANQPEAIYGFTTTATEITFQVYSGGCTSADDFVISRQQPRCFRGNPIPGQPQRCVGDMRVELVRVTPDGCRAHLPHGTLVTFSLSDLDLQNAGFILENPILNPYVKTGSN
jgi:hypothetical protein